MRGLPRDDYIRSTRLFGAVGVDACFDEGDVSACADDDDCDKRPGLERLVGG